MENESDSKYTRDGRAPIPESEATSRVMSANRGKDTRPEVVLRKALWQAGLRGYRLHWKNAPGRPDMSYPGRKVAVFVHGCFWHRCPQCNLPLPKTNTEYWKQKFDRNRERDRRKEKALLDEGWRVVTVWECEIDDNLEECIHRVERAIGER